MTVGFEPIKFDERPYFFYEASDDLTRVLDHTDQDKIEQLLLGRKVAKADDRHLVLDNGTVIKVIDTEGGCICGAGDYALSALNGVDNIITSVKFDYQPTGDDYDSDDGDVLRTGVGFYRVFVFADNEKINLFQLDGSDGNGYYGTGFSILVRDVVEAPE